MACWDEYPYKIEMHAHTSPVSPCSEIAPQQLVDTYEKLGYDAVVVTNHFLPSFLEVDEEQAAAYYLSDYRTACAHAKGKHIRVLLGMEIRFAENANDYLVYGIGEEEIAIARKFLSKGIDAFYQEFHKERHVILQAHPFRDGMIRANPESLDGIETFNMHPFHNSRCAVAQQYASGHPQWITTAGTDYHHAGHEGLTALRTKRIPKDSADLAEILKSRDYLFEIAGAIVIPHPQDRKDS